MSLNCHTNEQNRLNLSELSHTVDSNGERYERYFGVGVHDCMSVRVYNLTNEYHSDMRQLYSELLIFNQRSFFCYQLSSINYRLNELTMVCMKWLTIPKFIRHNEFKVVILFCVTLFLFRSHSSVL